MAHRRTAPRDAQIETGDLEYDQAKAHLDDCLALAGDCHEIHLSIDDSLRRLTNQAFFDKLVITDADTVFFALRARQQTSIASVMNASVLSARLNRLWA